MASATCLASWSACSSWLPLASKHTLRVADYNECLLVRREGTVRGVGVINREEGRKEGGKEVEPGRWKEGRKERGPQGRYGQWSP